MAKTTALSLHQAIKKLEHFCSYQDRCLSEVKGKLKQLGLDSNAAATILTHLEELDYLNEERFAQNFVLGKFRQKSWGRHRIQAELSKRKIPNKLIGQALSKIDNATYYEALDQLARKRLEALTIDDLQKRRRKLADYLLYRGWEYDLVYKKIRELLG